MALVEMPERWKKLNELASKGLEEKEGEFPARQQLKRLAKMVMPDPTNPASYVAPIGITKPAYMEAIRRAGLGPQAEVIGGRVDLEWG